MQSWMKSLLLTFLGALAIAYVGACVLFRAGENQFVFTRNFTYIPPSVSLALNQERVQLADGDTKFVAWVIPSLPQDRSDKWLLFFHGAGDNLSLDVNAYDMFRSMGFNIMAPEYPGYLDAPGEPNEAMLEREAQAAYNYLRSVKSVPARNIVIFGSSLGAAVAIDLASRVEAAALVEHAGFSSLVAMNQKKYPLLPTSFLTKNRFESDKKIGRVKMPVLLIHSTEDNVIPFAHAERLHEFAPAPKKLVKVQGGHGVSQRSAKEIPNFYGAIANFLNAEAGFRLRQPLPSIAPVIAETLDSKGIEAALAQYRLLRKEAPPRYNFRESELNQLGYDYLGDDKHDEAIAVLKLNTEQFPQSFNTFDSLGDAYDAAGKEAEAIASYRQSVALFSDKANYSRPKLDRLEHQSRSRQAGPGPLN